MPHCSSFAMKSKFNEKSTYPASSRIHIQLCPPSLMLLTKKQYMVIDCINKHTI